MAAHLIRRRDYFCKSSIFNETSVMYKNDLRIRYENMTENQEMPTPWPRLYLKDCDSSCYEVETTHYNTISSHIWARPSVRRETQAHNLRRRRVTYVDGH